MRIFSCPIGPKAAEIMRRIYQMALDGYGLAETAAALERDGVFNPTYYWRSKGTRRRRPTVYYNCIGAFSVPDRRKIPAAEITMGTRPGVAVSYSRSRIAV